MQVRSGAIVLKGGDHVGELVEPLGAVGHNASDPGARLPVVNSVASPHHHFWSKLIGEADARLEVAPVRHVVGALLGADKNFSAIQWDSYRLAGDRIGVDLGGGRISKRYLRIKPVLAVVERRARQGEVVTEDQVQGQFR